MSDVPIESGNMPVNHRVWQIVSAALCCFGAGSLYGWSALIPIVESSFTQSAANAGLIFSLAIVCFTSSVYATPRLPCLFQRLPGCAIFSLLGALSLIAASQATSYAGFVMGFSIGFGAASGAIYINALSVASASSNPTMTTPIMVGSFGLGGAVFGPVWRLLAAADWTMNVLLPTSLTLLLIALLTATVAISGKPVAERAEGTITESTEITLTKYQLKNLTLLIAITFGLGSMGGLMTIGMASKIVEHAGGSVLISSTTLLAVAIGNTTGRLSVSALAQKITPLQCVSTAASTIVVGLMITLTALLLSHNSLWVATGLSVVALGYGLMASAIPTLVRAVFGQASFARIYGLVFLAWGLAGLTAPWIAGTVFDETGSFITAITGALFLTMVALYTTRLSRAIMES